MGHLALADGLAGLVESLDEELELVPEPAIEPEPEESAGLADDDPVSLLLLDDSDLVALLVSDLPSVLAGAESDVVAVVGVESFFAASL